MEKSAATKRPRAKKAAKPIEQAEAPSTKDIRQSYVFGATFGVKPVTYEVIDGLAIFEGDIVLGTVEQMEQVKQSVEHPQPDIEGAIAITGNQFRWPNGVMPFVINASLPNQQRVRDAINHLEANTNLRFPARTNQQNWIEFRLGTNNCQSPVGMRGGQQFISLQAGCDWPRVVHEICHSAGLWHEQSREDRDRFVQIHLDNIAAADQHNFLQHITDGDDIGPYDYDSIMHYGRHDFAIDPTKDTITPIPDPNRAIGQRTGLSTGDILALNILYPRKATLGDTSTNGPALATRGTQVLLGWTGSGNLRLNFMSSNDGLNFAHKVTLGDVSPNALALTVFNGNYVVAWTGVGNNRLNVMQSNDGIHWGNKVTLGDTSLSAPALAVFGNQLLIAWRGVGNNQLNVMRSANGTAFSGKVTLGDTTTSGPTLAVLGNRLLIGWRGVGNDRLNVMRSTNGTTFGGKVTLGETTVSKPQLLARGNRVFLTWQGVGSRLLNILSSGDGASWGNKFISRETSIDGPVLSTIGANLVWGWTGTDAAHHLNTTVFNWV